MNGRSDPYVVVSSGDQKQKTAYFLKTLSPVWNEVFQLDRIVDDNILLEVFDSDYISNEKMCDVVLKASEVVDKPAAWYKLSDPEGQIKVEVLTKKAHRHSQLLEPHNFKICFNKMAGTVLAMGKMGKVASHAAGYVAHKIGSVFSSEKTDKDSGQETKEKSDQGSTWHSYPVYKIDMNHVPAIFSKENARKYSSDGTDENAPNIRQGWNREYHNAIKIFGPAASANLVRAGIVGEHKLLYGNLGHQPGKVFTGEQFLNLLNFGYDQNKVRMYTYVILEHRMYFAETSHSFAKDFLSKHAVLSNCNTEVVYSGEFHIQGPNENGEFILVVDNNSGTYSPDPKALELVKELFLANFPDLTVVALDREDPKLEHYKSIHALRNEKLADGMPLAKITTEDLEVHLNYAKLSLEPVKSWDASESKEEATNTE